MKGFLFTNCTMVQGELFMVGVIGGALAKMCLKDGKISYYGDLEGFIPEEREPVIDYMDYFEDKVIALNSRNDTLVVFDLEQHCCRYVLVGCKYQDWTNYVAMERYGSDYYIFPKYKNKILCFHMEKNRLKESSGYLRDFDELQCACRVKNDIWILPKDTNVIYCYNLPSGKVSLYRLGREISECVHAIFYNGNIYILNMYGVIYKWNTARMELSSITDAETEHTIQESMNRIIGAGNKLILLPAYGDDIKILDIVTEKVEIYRDYPADFWRVTDWLKFYGYCEGENKYYIATCFGNYLLQIEKKTGRMAWLKHSTDLAGARTLELWGKPVIREDNFEVTDLFKMNTAGNYLNKDIFIGDKIYALLKR